MNALCRVSIGAMIEYLAQHGGFYLEAAEILKQDRRMGIFHPEILVTHPSLPHIEADLPEREQIRSSAVCVSGFGAEDHTLERDQRYSSLDRHHNSLTCSQCLHSIQDGVQRDPLCS